MYDADAAADNDDDGNATHVLVSMLSISDQHWPSRSSSPLIMGSEVRVQHLLFNYYPSSFLRNKNHQRGTPLSS